MPYEEVSPAELSVDDLTIIHEMCSEVTAELTSDLLLNAYWIQRTSAFPIEESLGVKVMLDAYDFDWEQLIEKGESPLDEDDPRTGLITDDFAILPIITYLTPQALYTPRAVLKAETVTSEKIKLEKLKEDLAEQIQQALEIVESERLNSLLSLVGITVDEEGVIKYSIVDPAQLEGVRVIARATSETYRDFVRMNQGLIATYRPDDLTAVLGTGIENPATRAGFEATQEALGLETDHDN